MQCAGYARAAVRGCDRPAFSEWGNGNIGEYGAVRVE